jgi:hypothetical protein
VKTAEKRSLLREARNLGFVDYGNPTSFSGNRVRILKCRRGLRELKIQIWDDGKHTVSHGSITKTNGLHETTEPTGFTGLSGMYRAIAFEWQRESRVPG